MDIIGIGSKIATSFVPLLFALCFHEFAHAWVAKLRGDNTAESLGRLTLNPMVHADWIGTFALPLSSILFNIPVSFGWAKPVPVNSRNLKNPRIDMFWIALAGPLSNIFLACVVTLILGITLRVLDFTGPLSAFVQITQNFIQINLFLAIFNLIPLNPLDGGKVLARFLPASLNYKLEQNEHITSLILLVVILGGGFSFLGIPVGFLFHELMVAAQRIAG